MIDRMSLRLSATLLLVGQLLYIVIILFHADGEANNHPAVFAEYAASTSWTAVHVGQFACMAIMLAGLLALFFALDAQAGMARWAGRFGAVAGVPREPTSDRSRSTATPVPISHSDQRM